MIDLTDYRKEFGRFCSSVELARSETRSYDLASAGLERVTERFTHLFDRGTILELIELATSGGSVTETESAARRALAGAAATFYLEIYLRDHHSECKRCEAASRIDWQGERLDLSIVPARLASESERPARIDLEQRWLRAMHYCIEPRFELIAARDAAAQELGSDSVADLGARARGIDLAQWERYASAFLEQTEKTYFHALARLRARNDELQISGPWLHSDLLRWRRLYRFDRIFDGAGINALLELALGWMHLDIERQANLRIEFEPATIAGGNATLYRVQPPKDVRLNLRIGAGAWRYREIFDALGTAQHQAWTSMGVFERYPEFVYASDEATALGFGELFANLHLDRTWVASLYLRGNEETAAELVSEFALLGLHRVREQCAKLLFLRQHSTVSSLSADTAEMEYSEQIRTATGFEAAGPVYLWEPSVIGVVDRLRAAMFETLLLDHFRSGYGNRWWSNRKASDELRDIWSTGSRYSVEELAASLGLGEVGVEPTADRFRTLIERK